MKLRGKTDVSNSHDACMLYHVKKHYVFPLTGENILDRYCVIAFMTVIAPSEDGTYSMKYLFIVKPEIIIICKHSK